MSALALLLAIACFALLGLATDAHHARWFDARASASRKRRMRIGAWAALAAGFVAAIGARGWIFGPVLWAGCVMLGAGAVFLFLNFGKAPRALPDTKKVKP